MDSLKKYFGIILFLFGFIVLEGRLINVNDTLILFLGGGAILGFFLIYFPVHKKGWIIYILIFHHLITLLLIAFCPPIMRPAVISLSLVLLFYLLQKTGNKYFELVILSACLMAWLLFVLIEYHFSSLWAGMQVISLKLSEIASFITQRPINSNPSYTGIQLSVFYFILSLCAVFFIPRKKLLLISGCIFYILLINLLYVILQYYFSHWILHKFHVYYVDSLQAQLIFFLLLIPLVIFLFTQVKPPAKEYLSAFQLDKVFFRAITYVVFFSGVALLTFQLPIEQKGSKILFYDNGFLDWNLPDFDNFGSKHGGMFGLLPEYLEACNHEIAYDTLVSEKSLKDTDILVLINLMEKLKDTEKAAIMQFVEKGGALLVLGDHTGTRQLREPINDVLQDFGLAINFDCAMPFRNAWKNSITYYPHYITSGITSNFESNIFIGASLTITTPQARPIIVGRNGFSDPGNLEAAHNAYLGDMKYLQGELLGDQVLVAESSFGKGKAILFGDTSPFQNAALVQSYPFVNKVFQWLSHPVDSWAGNYGWMSLILITIAIVLVFFLKADLTDFSVFSILLGLGAISGSFFMTSQEPLEQFQSRDNNLAIIDASHIERFSMNQWEPQGYGGLCYNLMRNGFIPLLNTQGFSNHLDKAKLWVMLAPAKPFSRPEIDEMRTYMENGGCILISAGFEESAGVQKLLRSFGMNILNIPLGNITPDQNSERLNFPKAWAVECDAEACVPIFRAWGHSIAIHKKLGQGGVILLGDSKFLLNENLESRDRYHLENIMFFKQITETYIHTY